MKLNPWVTSLLFFCLTTTAQAGEKMCEVVVLKAVSAQLKFDPSEHQFSHLTPYWNGKANQYYVQIADQAASRHAGPYCGCFHTFEITVSRDHDQTCKIEKSVKNPLECVCG